MSRYEIQTKEANEVDYQHVGVESGKTGREAFERFCERMELSDGRFRVRNPDGRASSWAYLARIDSTTIQEP
jgi:hypothetical protein